ncbi:MAG: thioredoxin family protein [Bacteroidota bacterium]|nr:thioredoxin family protein [Bacteroidota bacterium]MDP4204815.1 thioredoxin family protein [Bacteroidota bacterium]
METKYLQRLAIVLILMISIHGNSYGQKSSQGKKIKSNVEVKKNVTNYKATFIELGSVRCIPCQKMIPVMKSIETKYGDRVKVEFHDVWTPEGRPFANIFGIQSIPTQIFLDENGKEFFRHEGYFSEEELVKVLKQKDIL